jgi:hypothetical protein
MMAKPRKVNEEIKIVDIDSTTLDDKFVEHLQIFAKVEYEDQSDLGEDLYNCEAEDIFGDEGFKHLSTEGNTPGHTGSEWVVEKFVRFSDHYEETLREIKSLCEHYGASYWRVVNI